MTLDILLRALLIFIARVCDVSLGTLRAASIVQGRKLAAWFYSFIQMVIWILVVADVIRNLNQPAYVFAFALGFASGTYIGMVIEEWLAHGRRVNRIFTRKGDELTSAIREAGFATTVFKGEGRDGPVQLLFIEARRKDRKELLSIAKSIDPDCYFVLETANVARA